MNTKEAVQAMLDGKKVRESHWAKDSFIYFDEEKLIDNNGYGFTNLNMRFSNDWEIYGEPIKHPVTVTFEKWIAKQDGGYIVVEGHKQKLRIIYGESLYRLIDTYEVEL